MPETTSELKLLHNLSVGYRSAQDAFRGLHEQRDRLIREAHAVGETYHAIAKATGLSRAQVQRICDLSKAPNPPLDALRHYVTGAIERGEAEAITEVSGKDEER